MNIFFFLQRGENHKTGVWEGGGGESLEEIIRKGNCAQRGRKIIVLPQVKNIVALLKSACKASYIIRMFKY